MRPKSTTGVILMLQQPIFPSKNDCYFYHSITYPDGETIHGTWDIRGRFNEYIGNYPIKGKKILDIGTASGFLAFSAEAAGAIVTGLEAASTAEFKRLPIKDTKYFDIRRQWREDANVSNLVPIKNSWWYGWHKFGSKCKLIYAPIEKLYDWDDRYDVVLAGAIIEHISDPVTAVGAMARVAREALIIAFTEVFDTDDLLMQPVMGMDPAHDYMWWRLSRGLYCQIFTHVGFDVEFVTARAIANTPSGPIEYTKPTIIARRRTAA
jgi:SAM-dependent methyltransferase